MVRMFAVGALLGALLVPAAGTAEIRTDDRTDVRVARAEVLSHQGHLLAEQRADFPTAASWLRSAAELRGPSLASVNDLMNAGHFHIYAHSSAKAMSAFHSAGQIALGFGDVSTASVAFRNAAFAAERIGDAEAAMRFLARSNALATEAAIVSAFGAEN